jgi:hypothetical protein
MLKKLLLISCLLLLSNCASKQSYIGASSTAAVAGTTCWQYVSDNPAVVATCAVVGSFKGADLMYNESDDQLMTRAFIDHLENAPQTPGFTTYMNPKTKSNGIIKTTGFYLKGPIKCTTVELTHNHNLDFTRAFDSILYGNPYRKMEYKEVCKMPDGRWRVGDE